MKRRDSESSEKWGAVGGRSHLSRRRARRHKLGRALALLVMVTLCGFVYAQKKDSCVDCHSRLAAELSLPVQQMEHNIHRARGLSCNDCHGGDPSQEDKLAAKNPRVGYLGKPSPEEIPAFCGKCHNDAFLMRGFNPSLRVDQVQEYFTSVHGQLLRTGNRRVATCVSCHGTHDTRAISDPLSSVYPLNVAETCATCHASPDHMKDFKIPTDQYTKYRASAHAKALYERQDLSAPTCNDCHGNHGATPPGVTSVAFVCGQCHVRQAELFRESPHKTVFDQMAVGECVQCHNNHDIMEPGDFMIGTAEQSVCISCHVAGDKGYLEAGLMRARLDDLSASIARSTEILDRAERAGMEVSRPKFELREAIDSLTHARVLIHASFADEVEKAVGPGLGVAQKGYQAGADALAELSFRRKGLVVSLFFILFLAALIYLKVREIERRQAAETPSE